VSTLRGNGSGPRPAASVATPSAASADEPALAGAAPSTAEREIVLRVGGWSSTCGECGQSCNPRSVTHDVVLGYDLALNGTPGCGARWTHMSSDYGEDLSWMRPDLIQIGYRKREVAP
jgi:hypothetical protein